MIRRKLATGLLVGMLGVTCIMASAETRSVVHNGSYNVTIQLSEGSYGAKSTCSTSGYNGTISVTSTLSNYDVRVLTDTYTNVLVEPGVTAEVSAGESFDTSYVRNSVNRTWNTNGLYLLSKAENTHMRRNPSNTSDAKIVEVFAIKP